MHAYRYLPVESMMCRVQYKRDIFFFFFFFFSFAFLFRVTQFPSPTSYVYTYSSFARSFPVEKRP